jgi:hypothetical protein
MNIWHNFLQNIFSFLQLVGFVYACYVISISMEEEDTCKYCYSSL